MNVGMISLLNSVEAGKTFLLKNLSVFEGGKAPGNHVLLSDPTVAFNHFRICRNDDEYVIYDQGAKNGTFVNGEEFEKVVLQCGDLIRAGDVDMRFDLVDPDTPGRLASCAPELDVVPLPEPDPVPAAPQPSDQDDQPVSDVAVAVAAAIRETPVDDFFEQPQPLAVSEPDQTVVQTVDLDPDEDVPSAAFTVLEGEDRGKTITIGGKTEYAIGRSSEADVRLRDSKISRTHCKVNVVGDHFIVTDNGSSNGTVVNGEPVRYHRFGRTFRGRGERL